MRFKTLITHVIPILICSACSVTNDYGNDVTLEKPFVLNDQPWKITEQAVDSHASRICTISAGEMYVTQRYRNNIVSVQVGTLNRLNPGDRYKILLGPHNYESLDTWFDSDQSQAIINNIMSTNVFYTERRELTMEGRGETYRSIDNKISTEGFSAQYQACTDYVTGK